MNYISICSGIEAATVAFKPFGWEPLAFSEIEPFPCELLQYYYPDVPNLGDMMTADFKQFKDQVDMVCGGTPCQAFSHAGNRKSLEDERGNLTLKFTEICDEVEPTYILWENVPGVLSTKDNAFGCFLGKLVGESMPLIPPRGKWTNAGYVSGPKRNLAWRTIDAQHFGVPQRRKRVFLIASSGGKDPREILFEPKCLQWDTTKSREKRKEITTTPTRSITTNKGKLASGNGVVGTIMANCGDKQWLGNQEAFSGDYHIIEKQNDVAFFSSQRSDEYKGNDVSYTLSARDYKGATDLIVHTPCDIYNTNISKDDKCCTVTTGTGETTKSGPKLIETIAYSLDAKDSNSMKSKNPHSGCREVNISKTLDTTSTCPSKNQGGIAIVETHEVKSFGYQNSATQGLSYGDNVPTLGTTKTPAIVKTQQPKAFIQNGRDNVYEDDVIPTITQGGGRPGQGYPAVIAPTLTASNNPSRSPQSSEVTEQVNAVFNTISVVRRLTPLECERLMGFPDNYTKIPYRGKSIENCPDSPRYKALGNSWAVPCVTWIAEQILKPSILENEEFVSYAKQKLQKKQEQNEIDNVFKKVE